MKLNEFTNAREYIAHVRDVRRNDDYTKHVVDVVESMRCYVCKSNVVLIDDHDNYDSLRSIVARVRVYRCVSCAHEIVVDYDKHDCVVC